MNTGWASMGAETPANRLKKARESMGLDQHEVALLIGINSPWYYDPEACRDLEMTLSLETLCHLAEVVRTDPLVLLIGDQANSVARTIQFEEIVRNLAAQMAAAGLDVEQFGERVGWDVTQILADPQALWDFDTDGFRDVTKAAGVEWTSAFPRTRRSVT